ncbi:MAG: hypothetical protein ACO30S_07115, partial [Flavobacteriaceae bacterium]
HFMRLGIEHRTTLIIETGIQNSGLGLMLIFTFFEGRGSMALIAAFWGIWHLISGLVVGLILRYLHNGNRLSYKIGLMRGGAPLCAQHFGFTTKTFRCTVKKI